MAKKLLRAAKNSRLEVVKNLLEKGVNIESKNKDNYTPLNISCKYGFCDNLDLETVKLLLKKGANIESVCYGGLTPIHNACRSNKSDIVKLLFEKGANFEFNCIGLGTLHFVCQIGNLSIENIKYGALSIVKLLLEKGANVESKVHKSICQDNLKVIKLLIENLFTELNPSSYCTYHEMDKMDDKCHEFVGVLEDYIFSTKIQYFFRIIMAKNVANRLRVEPRNLFDPEFSDRRKFLLKIDDSRFI